MTLTSGQRVITGKTDQRGALRLYWWQGVLPLEAPYELRIIRAAHETMRIKIPNLRAGYRYQLDEDYGPLILQSVADKQTRDIAFPAIEYYEEADDPDRWEADSEVELSDYVEFFLSGRKLQLK